MSKEEFRKDFKYQVYKNELDASTWKKGELVYEEGFDTEKDDSLALEKLNKWKEGKYLVEISATDKFGKEVSWKKFFTLYSITEKEMP